MAVGGQLSAVGRKRQNPHPDPLPPQHDGAASRGLGSPYTARERGSLLRTLTLALCRLGTTGRVCDQGTAGSRLR